MYSKYNIYVCILRYWFFCYTFVDINECSAVSNPCKDGSTCTNTDGGHQCGCPAGKEYDYENNICKGKASSIKQIGLFLLEEHHQRIIICCRKSLHHIIFFICHRFSKHFILKLAVQNKFSNEKWITLSLSFGNINFRNYIHFGNGNYLRMTLCCLQHMWNKLK